MAACWADIFRYLEREDESAEWFASLLENTNISFIRNALEGRDVRVLNKGGWLADPEYNAVCDCGIVESDGRRYLLVALSDQPSEGLAQARLSDLIRALYDSRDALR